MTKAPPSAQLARHLPALTAITAPSAASYVRLRPNRWAPTWANLGLQDRGASIRVCPVFGNDDPAPQFKATAKLGAFLAQLPA